MTKEEHILAIVEDSATDREAAERLREFLEPDHIPRNSLGYDCPMHRHGVGDIGDVAPALPGMRCAAVTGDDVQSGPIYCGRPGHLFGWSKAHPECVYILCESHARRHGIGLADA